LPRAAQARVSLSPQDTARAELADLWQNLAVAGSFDLRVEGEGEGYLLEKQAGVWRVSGGATGVLYGAHSLGFLLRGGEQPPDGFTLRSAPAFTHRIINHWDNMDGTIERGYAGRSLFFSGGGISYSEERIYHYARLLASVGVNAVAINNVNVRPDAARLITPDLLPQVAALAAIFRSCGVRLILSVSYASPVMLGDLTHADPRSGESARWWGERMNLIYSHVPDLLGVLIKADSENQPGPYQYDGCDQADGANLVAKAIAPHGGFVFWRCFVYNCKQDWRDRETDRPKAAYEAFRPIDGKFAPNVVLQVKNGPYDFQIREPVSPLLGAMPNTAQALEFQITGEYTGQQVDLCYLAPLWSDTLTFDTRLREKGRVADFAGGAVSSIAGVANTGDDSNWCGHALAAANLFAFGRLAWSPLSPPEDIAGQWCGLMFNGEARGVVQNMLLDSRRIYENYTTPLGMCWFVTPHYHYGPDPLGYEFSKWGTYHRADRRAVGIDRSPSGTGFSLQYAPPVADLYGDIDRCPEELLLFFHRAEYTRKLKSGKTLLQTLYDLHFLGAAQAEELIARWGALEGAVDAEIFANVAERLRRQAENARQWRDVFNTFFFRLSGIPDEAGRVISI
jgi:alpha-glucuronidase